MLMPKFTGEWRLNIDAIADKPGWSIQTEEDFVFTNPWRAWTAYAKDIESKMGNSTDLAHAFAPDQLIDDCSAIYDMEGNLVEPFLHLLPHGMPKNEDLCSDVLQDGDIIVFIDKVRQNESPLKQRGWHAELCYIQDGIVLMSAPWSDSVLRKNPVNEFRFPAHVAHVFRPYFRGIADEKLRSLLANVRLWREISPESVEFPGERGAPVVSAVGTEWYMDRVEFNSIDELRDRARAYLNRRDDAPWPDSIMTCVQWALTVFSLAIVCPLSRESMALLDVKREFIDYWCERLAISEKQVEGVTNLPVYPDSPAQVIQYYLDVYAGGMSLIKALRSPAYNAIVSVFGSNSVVMTQYFESVRDSGNIHTPLVKDGKTYSTIMPSSFFAKSRCPSSSRDSVEFRYVATLVHRQFLKNVADVITP